MLKIIIPARYSSQRLPGKPLFKVAGKPIIAHVVDRVCEAGVSLKDIYVATDDIRISNELERLHIPFFMTSKEHNSGSDRVNEVVKSLSLLDSDIAINVQGDEPLINPALIKQLIEFTKAKPDFDMWTVVVPIKDKSEFHNPNVVKAILGPNNNALYFTRAPAPVVRDEPESLTHAFRHIGVYAYKAKSLNDFCMYDEAFLEKTEKLEQLRALSNGMTIGASIFHGEVPHGVDTEEDFEAVKQIMESKNV